MYQFEGLPKTLTYGQEVRIKVTPAPQVALLMLYVSDKKKKMGGIVNIDQTTRAKPDTLSFKIPPKKHYAAKRYKPGYYLLLVSAIGAQGSGNSQKYLLKFA